MLDRPNLWKIIQGDPIILTFLSPFLFLSAITAISFFAQDLAIQAGMDVEIMARILAVLLVILAAVTWYRVRKINDIFDSGVEIMAEVLSIKTIKANMKLSLRYTFQGQVFERNYDQVITGKTKSFLNKKEIMLVVHRDKPAVFVLRDVYQ